MVKILLSLIMLGFPSSSFGQTGPAFGISFNMGEAFFPNHQRLRLYHLDLGYEWRSDFTYLSHRLWQGPIYVGLGAGGSSYDGGLVGYMGYEKRWSFFAMHIEGWAVVGQSGLITAFGYWGVSLLL